MLEPRQRNQKGRSYASEGLGEKELKTLYSLATPKMLKKGEVLFREGATDPTLYVVLEGEIRVVRRLERQPETITTLHQGAWLGEFGLTSTMPLTESAFATRPSRILAIDKAAVDALDEKTQMLLFKRLCLLASLRNRGQAIRESKLAIKNQQLMEALFSVHTKGKTDCIGSDRVQGVIKKLPKLPAFASTLAGRLLLEGTSLREITEMIKADPSLTGVVMKTINSVFYGFYKKISDVHRAVVLLGVNELYRLLIGEGVRRTMPDTLYFRNLHAHSLAVSYIASALAQKSQRGNPAQVATIGLLHDLGHVVAQLLTKQDPVLDMLIDAQHRAQMGALLLKQWNVPDVVWRSVAFQCYPEFCPPAKIPPEIRINVTLLYLSHLCYDFFAGRSEHDLPTLFQDDYLSLLTWGRLSVSEIARQFVLPDLIRKRRSFPLFLRELLEKHLQQTGLAESAGGEPIERVRS